MITVAVVEDHPATRMGLEQIISAAPTLDLAVAVASVEALEARGGLAAHVVILDLGLGGGGLEGAAAVSHIRGQGARVLVLSMSGEEVPVLDAISAGAHGYLTKDAEPTEIIRAINTVAQCRTYFSATVAGYLLRNPARLTERELEILRLVASGETTSEIAKQLFISEKTVNGHLDHIRDKTGYRRRADLTRLAYEKGVIGPNRRSRLGQSISKIPATHRR